MHWFRAFCEQNALKVGTKRNQLELRGTDWQMECESVCSYMKQDNEVMQWIFKSYDN